MFHRVGANSKPLHFQAEGFFANIENLQNIQRQFSQDAEVESRLLFKGVVIILPKGNVQAPVMAFYHPMTANRTCGLIDIQRQTALCPR